MLLVNMNARIGSDNPSWLFCKGKFSVRHIRLPEFSCRLNNLVTNTVSPWFNLAKNLIVSTKIKLFASTGFGIKILDCDIQSILTCWRDGDVSHDRFNHHSLYYLNRKKARVIVPSTGKSRCAREGLG